MILFEADAVGLAPAGTAARIVEKCAICLHDIPRACTRAADAEEAEPEEETDTEAAEAETEAEEADAEARARAEAQEEARADAAEAAAVKAETALIVADTNELQGEWVDGGRLDLILDARASQSSVDGLNDISAADVNAQCDTAISDASLATAASVATVDSNVDAII